MLTETELRYEALRALNAGEPIALVVGRAEIKLSDKFQQTLRPLLEEQITEKPDLSIKEIEP